MAIQILLGPQNPQPNVRQAIGSVYETGPIIAITAGWRDSEGDLADLETEIGKPVENLDLYHRAEAVFAREPELRSLKRERQDKLAELQRLYRIRLSASLSAARKLMRETADPGLLRLEQRAAVNQLRALDRHHLRRIQAIHKDFDLRRAELRRAEPSSGFAESQRDEVQDLLAKAGLVLIAGGHVAVLLNRIRMFSLGDLLADKNIIAWSAGAMALSERIVLFHHNSPQGKRDAELLDAGLGIVPRRVLLPDSRHRLAWHNRERMALFARRFAPSSCCTLDNGSLIQLEQGKVTQVSHSSLLLRSGRARMLAP